MLDGEPPVRYFPQRFSSPVKMSSWVPYLGVNAPNKGKQIGWKNTATGDVRYQEKSPESAERKESDPETDEQESQSPVAEWARGVWGDRKAKDGSLIADNFVKWFGNSKIVDDSGYPEVLYHGTLANIGDVFDVSKTTPESSVGRGVYMTNEPEDAGANYASEHGPDVDMKLGHLADQLAGGHDEETGEEIDRDRATELAREMIMQHEGAVLPLFAKVEKPLVIGGDNPTKFTYKTYGDDGEPLDVPQGTLVDFLNALHEIASEYPEENGYGSVDVQKVISDVYEWVLDIEEIEAEAIIEKILKHDDFMYITEGDDDYGTDKLASSDVVRKALQKIGYDGVIDNNVYDRWGKPRISVHNRGFQGMTPETRHVIAFDGKQIKSAIGNSGKFSNATPSLAMSSVVFMSAWAPYKGVNKPNKGKPIGWKNIRTGDVRYQDEKPGDSEMVSRETQEETTPRRHTNSPEFKSWFGESKVVDSAGKPLVVYHGSRSSFDSFKTKDTMMFDRFLGAHFAEDPSVTDAFTTGEYALAHDYSIDAWEPERSWYRDDKGELVFGDQNLVFIQGHGHDQKTEPFDPEKHGKTAYSDKRKEFPESYVRPILPGGQVYPVYLSINNPLVVELGERQTDQWEIPRRVAELVLPESRELFIDAMKTTGRGNSEELGSMWDALKAGKEYKVSVDSEPYKSFSDVARNFASLFSNAEVATRAKAELQKLGYDGVKYTNTSGNEVKGGASNWAWIAFEPEQVKSAIANRGTYDRTNPNMNMSTWNESEHPREPEGSAIGGQFTTKTNRTSSEAFKKWFGNSKVVDAEDKPLVVYHATRTEFDEFKPGGKNPEISGPAIWFVGPEGRMSPPAAHNTRDKAEGARVIPAFVKITNPLVLDNRTSRQRAIGAYADESSEFPLLLTGKQVEAIRRDGYDGIIFDHKSLADETQKFLPEEKWLVEYIVFDPTQIKSAIGNRGTFDPSNPNIKMSTWVRYVGPRDGRGWRNTANGDVRYQDEMPGENDADKQIESVKLYRGEWTGNRGGSFYHPDKEFARQFTQSGQDHEITEHSLKASDIYKADPLPYGGDQDELDAAIATAKSQGFKAVYASEGQGYKPSVYVFDAAAFDVAHVRETETQLSPTEFDPQEFDSLDDALDVAADADEALAAIKHFVGDKLTDVKFQGGQQVWTDGENVYEVDKNGGTMTELGQWIYDVDPTDYFPDYEKKINDDFWDVGNAKVYHATDSDNVESIQKTGIEARDETRGITNRNEGHAVYTTTDFDEAVTGSYGDAIFEIDTAAMARDKYTPWAAQEPDIVEYELRTALVHALGNDTVHVDEYESGMSPTTMAIFGDIPAKYLKLVDGDGPARMSTWKRRRIGFGRSRWTNTETGDIRVRMPEPICMDTMQTHPKAHEEWVNHRDHWIAYAGPLDGHGWQNTITGEVRYVKERPGSREKSQKALPFVDWDIADSENLKRLKAQWTESRDRVYQIAEDAIGKGAIAPTPTFDSLPDETKDEIRSDWVDQNLSGFIDQAIEAELDMDKEIDEWAEENETAPKQLPMSEFVTAANEFLEENKLSGTLFEKAGFYVESARKFSDEFGHETVPDFIDDWSRLGWWSDPVATEPETRWEHRNEEGKVDAVKKADDETEKYLRENGYPMAKDAESPGWFKVTKTVEQLNKERVIYTKDGQEITTKEQSMEIANEFSKFIGDKTKAWRDSEWEDIEQGIREAAIERLAQDDSVTESALEAASEAFDPNDVDVTAYVTIEHEIEEPGEWTVDEEDPFEVDYQRCRNIGRWIQSERFKELYKEYTGEDFEELGNPIDHMSEIWEYWKDSSTNDKSLKFQIAAADELGLNSRGSIALDDVKRIDDRVIGQREYWGFRAAARAMWEASQYLMERAGIDSVVTYRGIRIENLNVDQVGLERTTGAPVAEFKQLSREMKIKKATLNSSSSDRHIANNWAASNVIIRAEVPREAVMSAPVFGVNYHQEREYVTMGTKWLWWDAWFHRAPDPKDVPPLDAAVLPEQKEQTSNKGEVATAT